jgi:hypothetical protein
MNSLPLPRSAKFLCIACVSALLLMVVFRFAIYRHMYIGPDDPYGLSDIIEFLLGWLLIGILGASALWACVLLLKAPRNNWKAALVMMVVAGLVLALAVPLHTLAARWAP